MFTVALENDKIAYRTQNSLYYQSKAVRATSNIIALLVFKQCKNKKGTKATNKPKKSSLKCYNLFFYHGDHYCGKEFTQ